MERAKNIPQPTKCIKFLSWWWKESGTEGRPPNTGLLLARRRLPLALFTFGSVSSRPIFYVGVSSPFSFSFRNHGGRRPSGNREGGERWRLGEWRYRSGGGGEDRKRANPSFRLLDTILSLSIATIPLLQYSLPVHFDLQHLARWDSARTRTSWLNIFDKS